MSNPSDFVIENGVLKEYKGPGGDVDIPEGVTRIGDNAFRYCSRLVSVKIPGNVTSIGKWAFYGCYGLMGVTIPDSVTSIGYSAFSWCRSLTSVTIPDGVTSIGESAFEHCKSLTSVTIPEGTTGIASSAFRDCSSMTSVMIPDSVSSIGNSAFEDCKSLTSVTIPDSVTSIGVSAFSGCSRLISVAIPNTVKSIDRCAFRNCSRLTSVTIPEGVKSIGAFAFECCSRLMSVTIPDSVTSIDSDAFTGTALCKDDSQWQNNVLYIGKHLIEAKQSVSGSYSIRSGTLCIGGKAFYGCSSLTGVTIPDSVKSIGVLAFESCSSLSSVTIPDSVKSIGGNAFSGCDQIKFHISSEAANNPDCFQVKNGVLERYIGPGGDVIIPNSVTSISYSAFSGCSSLTGVTIPEGVTSIGKYAFNDCSSLISITIPEGVTSIGDYAFIHCRRLMSVAIPDSVTSIGNKAFEGCIMLRQVELSKALSQEILARACLCAALDETAINELITQAKKEKNKYLRESLLETCMASDTRAAMLLAERRKKMDEYAALRGMTEDELRDRYLSDLGLNIAGCKTYDLGNMTVTVRMNRDFSFVVELPDGKTAKSLPRKGADPTRYEAANKDFAQVKKDSRKIWKNRADLLLGDFISGKTRTAAYWAEAYGSNPILHGVACLLVWEQGGKTFLSTDEGLIAADGSPYVLTDAPIKVAHPIEMEAEKLETWQKHFTAHGLKQPFAQIWEPAYKPEEIAPDRYAGCPILFFQLQGAEKHGFDHHLEIPGCNVEAKWSSETASNGNQVSYCDIRSFKIKTFSRAVNHALAYLDRVTIEDRIAKDDANVMRSAEGCNIAQITEFIKLAQEANAVNVLALLLDYKNTHFADFDPMDEFTLE